MDLMQLLNSDMAKQLIGGISQKTGDNEEKVSGALQMASSVLLGAMDRNTNSKEGADGLFGALQRDHDGSILDNIEGFLSNPDMKSGQGIIGHVLGNKTPQVENAIGKSTGLSSSSVQNIMQMAAPIIMGYLGKQTKENGLGASQLSGLLSGMKAEANYNSGEQVSLVERLLDSDGDGSIIDDVAGIGMKLFSGFFKK